MEPLGHRYPPDAEPLAAEPIAIRESLRSRRPSIEDEFVDWTTRYFTERAVPKSRRTRVADVEVVLSPDEAAMGAILPIHLPAFGICRACGGSGHDWFSSCLMCQGAGVVEGRRAVGLRLPAMVHDGTIWEVAVPEGGLQLRIRIRIDPYGW